ncbi:MAG: hypothetical protein E6K53_15435 [Gammaproteobacteria bacterium]|nr:MAG: hypothetical protein E6K53_15435 [Gammaproteobacteria bacterium]
MSIFSRCKSHGATTIFATIALVVSAQSFGASVVGAAALSDIPVYSASNVPANLMLALSVEFPTGTVAAYTGASDYSASFSYLGYFDNAKCYDYDTTNKYFVPSGSASSGCTGHWSGNMLNWASMTALDEFRQALTGGYRVFDDTSKTVLQRSRVTGQGSAGNFPTKHIGKAVNVMPSSVIGDKTFGAATVTSLRTAPTKASFSASPSAGTARNRRCSTRACRPACRACSRATATPRTRRRTIPARASTTSPKA